MMWLLTTAAAWAVNVEICVKYDVAFADSDVSGATEDLYHDNGLKPALGIRIEAASLFNTYAENAATSGTDAGCATFALPSGTTYTVKAVSTVTATTNHKASVLNGGFIPLGDHFEHVGVSSWTPVAGSYNITLPAAPRWQALAVVGLALVRNTASRPSLDLDIYVPNPPTGLWNPPAACTGTDTCLDGTDLWLTNADADLKFRTAHFLGWVMLQDMGYDRASLDKSADDDHCHVSDRALTFGNLEHTSTGFAEGFAYYYASTVFNYSTEANCSFVFWEPSNWDQLEVCHAEKEAAAGHVLSCATGPSLPPYEPIVPETNYRAYCLEERSPDLAAASKPDDSVTPIDVVRFLNDRVYTDGGLTRSEVGGVFESAVSFVGTPPTFRFALITKAGLLGANEVDWSTAASLHGVNQ